MALVQKNTNCPKCGNFLAVLGGPDSVYLTATCSQCGNQVDLLNISRETPPAEQKAWLDKRVLEIKAVEAKR